MPLFLCAFFWRPVFIPLPSTTRTCQNPDSSSFLRSPNSSLSLPSSKNRRFSWPPHPGVCSSCAVSLSLCTCPARALPAPLLLQPRSSSEPPVPTPTRPPVPRFLPCCYRAVQAAFALPLGLLHPQTPSVGRHQALRLAAAFRRENSLSPPVRVILSPRLPLKCSQGSQEKQLKTTFYTPNSAEQRARAPTATRWQSSPSHRDPAGPSRRSRRSAAARRRGTGKESPGRAPRARLYVCLCALGLSRC